MSHVRIGIPTKSIDHFKSALEKSIVINGITHILPKEFEKYMNQKFIKQMDKVPEDHELYMKWPDYPGMPQGWEIITHEDVLDIFSGMQFRSVNTRGT